MKIILLFTIIISAFLFQAGLCQNIQVNNAVVLDTPPNAKNGGAFMEIKNLSDKEMVLTGAESSASRVTEIHTHIMENGMKKMIQIPEIKIAPKSTAVLKRGSDHLMLIDLKKPLKVGDTVNIKLIFANKETYDVNNIKVVKP